MIKLNAISVSYNKGTPLVHEVLSNFSLEIDSGSFVTVIGGNGAGKSTLMNVISGDNRVESGQIWLDDTEVTHKQPFERAALISRVFQDPLLGSYADLTIEENLSLAYSRGKKRGLTAAVNTKLRKQFQSLVSSLGIGLEDRLTDKIGLLSGGQRQVISLLMATIRPAKILLLDEHTAALDPKMERLVLELTQRMIQEHALTALMITHNVTQALEFGTRTLMMHQGKVVRDLKGDARKALTAAELLDCY